MLSVRRPYVQLAGLEFYSFLPVIDKDKFMPPPSAPCQSDFSVPSFAICVCWSDFTIRSEPRPL